MMEIQRPSDSESFTSHPPNQFFDQGSLDTPRSSQEQTPRLHRDVLKSKLERENRRQQKAADRTKLHDEVTTRLREELLHHEELQRQLHTARDSLDRRRSYAEKAEQEAQDLELSLSSGALKEDQLSVELAKIQVELAAYRSRMEGIEQELQKARDMTDEITTDRDKARDEARQLREERRQAAEQRRIDEARREGIMRGKLEGMYAGWEDGKVQGYKEGRGEGSRVQHETMLNKDWRALQREFPNYDRFEERIPSPESYDGDAPERLRELEAPIILPPTKKPRRPPPIRPPDEHDDDDHRMITRTVHSSPETIQETMPPQVIPHPMRQPSPPSMPVPSTSHQQPEPTPRERPRSNIPPPRPIFLHDDSSWQPPTTIPDTLKRSNTLHQLGERFRRKPEEISHAPHDMDFAPIAAPGQYPTVATPLPHWETLQPGRAIPTPAGSIHEFKDDERDRDKFHEEDIRNRYSYEDPRNKLGKVMMSSFSNMLHPKASRTPYNIAKDPRTYDDARSTITMPSLIDRSREQSPAPSPKTRPSQPDRIIPVPVKPAPSPRHSRISMLPDNYIPPLDADGGFSLPPPHELNGSAMQSAINLTLSQNPSRNPSRNPSPTPGAQPPRSAQRSRDPSPLGRLGGSIKHAASAVIHNMPSLTKARDQFRGRSRSPGHSQSPSPIEEARARARSRSRSRPRSTEGFNETYSDGQQNLLRPEDIYIAPSTASDNGSFRGRDPGRRYTGMSQNSPISQRSILDMNGGALGLTRGGDARDIGFVTYPNASTANLSMIEEERARHSGYNPTPSPNMRTTTEHHLPAPTADYYQPRPSGSQRQFSDGSINRRDTQDVRDGWDTSSRYPPPPPSMKSPTSTIDYPPTGPAKSATSASHPYPWSNRPVPSKITMPALLGPQSPATSSKAGFAGIGAGANYHRRAASVVVPGERNFASPHPSVRLSMAGSIAGSESGRPPIAPKPQPPSRRSKIVNSINLDDPPGEGTPYQNPGHVATRSWSGEQRQIGRTIPTKPHGNTAMRPEFTGSQPLVTVEEKSPYLQGPSARGSTGSLNSVHSNRLKFDPKEYVDPAYLVPTDLTAVLEKQIGQPPPPSNEGPAISVVTKAGKRVSKVLRLGKKNK